MTPMWMCLLIGAAAMGDAKKFEPTPDEIKLAVMTNAERKQKDVPPLKLSLSLCKVARAHSENMASQEKLDHVLDDKTPFDRLKAAGYRYFKAGENVGFENGGNLDMILKNWMESEGHRANILNPDYVEIGIGIARAKDGSRYYTQVFAKPRK